MDGQKNDMNGNSTGSEDNGQSQGTDSENFFKDLLGAAQGDNLSQMRTIYEGFSLYQESDDE